MEKYTGVIVVSYEMREVKIPYVMDYLGGNVHIYYQDKHGGHGGFFYRPTEEVWLSMGNKSPVWPTDFAQRFFSECKKEAVRHGLLE